MQDASAPPKETALSVPGGQIEVAYVPPAGKQVEFEVQNRSDREVRITGVERSCGCMDVLVPDVIPAGQTKTGTLHLTGDPFPGKRNAQFVLKTDSPIGAVVVPVLYGTGEVPCLQPPRTQFNWVNGVLSASTTLWLQTSDSLTLVFEPSDFNLDIIPTDKFAWDAESGSLRFQSSGVCNIPIRLRLRKATSNGIGQIAYSCGGERHVVSVPYAISAGEAVSLEPGVANLFVESAREEAVKRVFIASAPFSFLPKVIDAPVYCDAKFEKVSDRQWKLIVVFNPRQIPQGATDCEIQVQSEKEGPERTLINSCVIHIRKSEF